MPTPVILFDSSASTSRVVLVARDLPIASANESLIMTLFSLSTLMRVLVAMPDASATCAAAQGATTTGARPLEVVQGGPGRRRETKGARSRTFSSSFILVNSMSVESSSSSSS